MDIKEVVCKTGIASPLVRNDPSWLSDGAKGC